MPAFLISSRLWLMVLRKIRTSRSINLPQTPAGSSAGRNSESMYCSDFATFMPRWTMTWAAPGVAPQFPASEAPLRGLRTLVLAGSARTAGVCFKSRDLLATAGWLFRCAQPPAQLMPYRRMRQAMPSASSIKSNLSSVNSLPGQACPDCSSSTLSKIQGHLRQACDFAARSLRSPATSS